MASGGDQGGAKTHIISVASQLCKQNELILVSFRKGNFAESAKKAGIKVVTITHLTVLGDLIELIKVFDGFKPEIVHSHGSKPNMMSIILRMFRRFIGISTIHSDYRRDYMHSRIKQITFGTINTIALHYMDYVVGITEVFCEMLMDRRFNPLKLFTIYNGIDFSVELPPVDRAAYLKSIGLNYNEGDVVVGAVARLTAVKDLPTLLKAYAIAVKQVPNLKLVMAGDGEDGKKLKNLAKKLGIEKTTCFPGWIKEPDSLYSCLDIDVLCSLTETFPYSLTEGVRGHCTLIATAVGGVPELIDHGINGYIINVGDYEKLAEHLVRLAKDRELRKNLSDALLQKAQSRFSLQATANDLQEIYERVKVLNGMKGRQGVVICGSYGKQNTGDDAIQRAIVAQMRSIYRDIPIFIMTRSPAEARRVDRAQGIFTFNFPSFISRFRKSKLFINGGGSLIQDSTSSRSLYFYLFTLIMAKLCGCKVLMYGCGIGPVTRKMNRRIAGYVLNKYIDAITLRDEISVGELASMGVTRPAIHLSADPALNLTAAPEDIVLQAMKQFKIDPNGRYMLMALRKWKGFEASEVFAQACAYAYERYGLTAVFLPFEYPSDCGLCTSIARHMTTPYHIIDKRNPPELTLGIMKRMELVTAMRLHALIFATIGGVPTIGISYDVKVSSFLKYIQNPSCLGLPEVTVDSLCKMIDSTLKNRQIAESSRDILLSREKVNVNVAREMLKI